VALDFRMAGIDGHQQTQISWAHLEARDGVGPAIEDLTASIVRLSCELLECDGAMLLRCEPPAEAAQPGRYISIGRPSGGRAGVPGEAQVNPILPAGGRRPEEALWRSDGGAR
jgi:hypothetical protein